MLQAGMGLNHNIQHLENNWGVFLGSFNNNLPHKHFAIQLSIPVAADIKVSAAGKVYSCSESILIQFNIEHSLNCDGIHLLLLFNPTSATGHFFKQMTSRPVSCFYSPVVSALQKNALLFLHGNQTEKDFRERLKHQLHQFERDCSVYWHMGDERIGKALDYLFHHADRVVPLEEIAGHCFLSTSRFLHLFKEQTGVTYRRAQLWTRISQSVPELHHQSVTQTAHQYGFTDSAHYNRAFKETFGLLPKAFKG